MQYCPEPFDPNDYPNYIFSSTGSVWSIRHKRFIKPWKGGNLNRYSVVRLWNNSGKGKIIKVHQIVMLLYGPPQPSTEHVIDHIDSDRENNTIENLQWLHWLENCRKGVQARKERLANVHNQERTQRTHGHTHNESDQGFHGVIG